MDALEPQLESLVMYRRIFFIQFVFLCRLRAFIAVHGRGARRGLDAQCGHTRCAAALVFTCVFFIFFPYWYTGLTRRVVLTSTPCLNGRLGLPEVNWRAV